MNIFWPSNLFLMLQGGGVCVYDNLGGVCYQQPQITKDRKGLFFVVLQNRYILHAWILFKAWTKGLTSIIEQVYSIFARLVLASKRPPKKLWKCKAVNLKKTAPLKELAVISQFDSILRCIIVRRKLAN